MSINSSQVGQTPLEPQSSNNSSQDAIVRLISNNTISTGHPSVEISERNMILSQIPVIPQVQHNIVLNTRQEGRRRRRQRQRQRRRERLQALRQPNHQYRRNTHWRSDTTWDHLDPLEEPMDEIYNEPLLNAYEWETMDPRERWDQEQINELEGFAALEYLQLIQDELEQEQNIEYTQQILEEEEIMRNNNITLRLLFYETMIQINQTSLQYVQHTEEHLQQYEDNEEQLQQIEHVQEILEEEATMPNNHLRS
ncbi:unnamed protein product [Adineta ricciae]|uniref:Uncharacterized protein n=1 Tax=Adineta ricciae TaxID=249248 RepID=A0A815QIU6_ADIRI|nr:unnamed protein product [Adineta ricciae]CAF1543928.1 unnamed protein product [Adineta ricciae]